MVCNCKDWKENIDLMNAGFALSTIHGMGGYEGKPISFCPWCGDTLEEER